MAKHCYEYPRPAVSADCLVLAWDNEALKILLIQRGNTPFKNEWALPGGFLEMGENLDEAAKRELQEETGLTKIAVEQQHTYGDVGRDPRARVITVAYLAMVRMSDHQVQAADDAIDTKWFPLKRLPKLAFDHRKIVNQLKDSLKKRLRCQPFGLELLPKEFPIHELYDLYEFVLGHAVNKRTFKSQLMRSELLVERSKGIYQFDKRKYRRLTRTGFSFPI